MEFLIVTGMSGAGKSRTIAALEDIGYYCVDNLPAVLLAQFAQLFLQAQEGETRRVALVADSRGTAALGQFDDCLRAMREQQIPYKVMFLDCEDEVLMRRYKETRRRHPLTRARRHLGHRGDQARKTPFGAHQAGGGLSHRHLAPDVGAAAGAHRAAVHGCAGKRDDGAVHVLRLQIRHAARGGSCPRRALLPEPLLSGHAALPHGAGAGGAGFCAGLPRIERV